MSTQEANTHEMKELHWMMDMLTNVDVGLVVIDSSYCIHMWNRFMVDHSGKADPQVKFKSIFEVFPELPKSWFKHKIDSVFLLKTRAFSIWEQRPYLFRFKNYRPITGIQEVMYQNATMIPLLSADGSVNHVALLIYDVTDIATNKQELTRANEQLEVLSKTDRLTGLSNRGYWEECFRTEYERCQRYGSDCTLMIFDIDHFKSVNDNFGHQAGDEAIRETARLMKEMIRSSDISGRYGGEEFVAFLPNTDVGKAKILAERYRKMVEGAVINYDGKEITFTISIGLAEFSKDFSSHEQWIEQADQALYHSKQNGRNQITVI